MVPFAAEFLANASKIFEVILVGQIDYSSLMEEFIMSLHIRALTMGKYIKITHSFTERKHYEVAVFKNNRIKIANLFLLGNGRP